MPRTFRDEIIRSPQRAGWRVCLQIITCLLIAITRFSGQLNVWFLPRPSVGLDTQTQAFGIAGRERGTSLSNAKGQGRVHLLPIDRRTIWLYPDGSISAWFYAQGVFVLGDSQTQRLADTPRAVLLSPPFWGIDQFLCSEES